MVIVPQKNLADSLKQDADLLCGKQPHMDLHHVVALLDFWVGADQVLNFMQRDE